ncbi:MAG: FAD-dependent oxidoreductase [Frankiales bacterium]|nr:FAD-dependent oxidoreductase [Frankiales bacterium]
MQTGQPWRNWARNQAMTPVRVEHPGSVDELAGVVKQAAADGLRVKAIGSGHSFTAIGLTDGVLVQLDRMTRLLSVDRATSQVTVEAGTVLHDLNATLATYGLGLTNMGDIDVQTVSGALSTGTHGTGRDSGALATQVVALDLVLADGSVVTCSRTERPDLFAAARLGLGALGVIATVTLQAEPAFLLRADERPMPLDEVLRDLDAHVSANEHFEFYWFPHTDVALTKRNNRVDGPVAPLPRVKAWVDDELLSNGLFALTCRLGAAVPAVVPAVNRVCTKALSARTYTDRAPHVFTSPRRVRFREMEYAVPREALVEVLQQLRTLPERTGQRISFPVEVRVAPADDIALSTASGRDSAYVAVHQYLGTPYEQWFASVEPLFDAVGGRPHWGKLHTLGAEQLSQRYPRFGEFTALRDRLDPERRFGNAYLERVLGS